MKSKIYKLIDTSRFEEIIESANPKFNWWYSLDDKLNLKMSCDECYNMYLLKRPDNLEQALATISHLTGLMKDNNFKRRV